MNKIFSAHMSCPIINTVIEGRNDKCKQRQSCVQGNDAKSDKTLLAAAVWRGGEGVGAQILISFLH